MTIKKIVERSYWAKLFYRDKRLFFIIFIFFFLSIFFNFIKLGTTPFFLLNMYAVKIPPQIDYPVYEVHYGDNKLINIPHTWEQPRKMLLFEPLRWYTNATMKISAGEIEKEDQDPFGYYLKNDWGPRHPRFRSLIPYLYDSSAQFNAFPAWYKRYLSSQVPGSVGNIYVVKKLVRFDDNGWVKEISSEAAIGLQ